MIGVFAAAALKDEDAVDLMRVRSPFAKLTLALSVFHLAAVAATIVAFPFIGTVAGADARAMSLFETSNLWLGPLQGLVAAVIGALFFSRTESRDGAAQPATTKDPSDTPG